MRQEFHVTVDGDPFKWRGLCASMNIKPLWIELNNFERQLMCAITGADMLRECVTNVGPYVKDFERAGFQILRTKHEVEVPKIEVTTHGQVGPYYVDGQVTEPT